MRFLVMVQGSQADYDAMSGRGSAEGGPAWSEQDQKAMFAHMEALNKDLEASGEMLYCDGLTAPDETRFVTASANGGPPVVADAPYDRTQVLLAGYWVLDCAGLERATEIAARVVACPQPEGAPYRPVAIRPIGQAPEEDLAPA
ncbi:YciI family protein [Streptomyces sp. NBC_00247]|uniref:YciI family protein n=1 Tax=Streptomyces sp. NBC_00247 TaxID=2975689 RepID=UPI002E2B099C|nr:YciI family protein [Streptomyces sp. NBC_00247]